MLKRKTNGKGPGETCSRPRGARISEDGYCLERLKRKQRDTVEGTKNADDRSKPGRRGKIATRHKNDAGDKVEGALAT